MYKKPLSIDNGFAKCIWEIHRNFVTRAVKAVTKVMALSTAKYLHDVARSPTLNVVK